MHIVYTDIGKDESSRLMDRYFERTPLEWPCGFSPPLYLPRPFCRRLLSRRAGIFFLYSLPSRRGDDDGWWRP